MKEIDQLVKEGYEIAPNISISDAEKRGLNWTRLLHPDGSYTLFVKKI